MIAATKQPPSKDGLSDTTNFFIKQSLIDGSYMSSGSILPSSTSNACDGSGSTILHACKNIDEAELKVVISYDEPTFGGAVNIFATKLRYIELEGF